MVYLAMSLLAISERPHIKIVLHCSSFFLLIWLFKANSWQLKMLSIDIITSKEFTYLGLSYFWLFGRWSSYLIMKIVYQMTKGPHFLGMHGLPCDDTVSYFRMTSYENTASLLFIFLAYDFLSYFMRVKSAYYRFHDFQRVYLLRYKLF